MELEAMDGKRLQALDRIMIQKKKRWLEPTTSRSGEREMKKGSSFGKWCYPSVLKTNSWGNGLLVGKEYSRFTKYCSEMPTGYQALKGSHTKGLSMGNTSRNTFPQCGKYWILPRKTKVGNEEITSKIGPIDHFGT